MKWYHKKPSAISCVWYGKVLSDSFSARGVVSFTRSAGAGMGSRMVVVEVEHAVKEGMRDGGVKMRKCENAMCTGYGGIFMVTKGCDRRRGRTSNIRVVWLFEVSSERFNGVR